MRIVQLTTDNREQQNDYDKPMPRFGTAPEALIQGFSVLPDVEVHVISCVRRKVSIPEQIFGNNVFYHAVKVPKSGWMTSGYLGCIRATRKLIRALAPDIVHGQGTERDCAMTAVHSGMPNVVTIHGNMAELNRLGETFQTAPLYGRMASILETYALGKTSGVFCNSAYTESLVAPRARRTWRVPNAIRNQFFQAPTGSTKSDIPQIINVGLVSLRKRQLELLRNLRGLWKRGSQFRMVFVGAVSASSPYGIAFLEELRRAEADGYATHAGFLGIQELIELMDQSQAMIHCPSEEAFGLVVAEAMARGLRFFGADLGGIRDVAQGIPGADLYPDIPTLLEGVAEWISEGAPTPTGLKDRIAGLYHPEVVATRHIEIYHEVLERA